MATKRRLIRTTKGKTQDPSTRRGMLPFSGILIIFGILMLGSALAIPASRAMQEAEMRDRVASFGSGSTSGQTNPPPATNRSGSDSDVPALPAIAEQETEEENDEINGQLTTPVDTGRGRDTAATIEALRSHDRIEESGDFEPEAAEMPPPTHLRIPDVGIDTKIVEVGYDIVEIEGQRVREWEVASYAAGHHKTSANPGEGRNIVVTGHNDWEGEVFRTLEYVEAGYEVFLETDEGEHKYVVEEIHMRREVGVSMDERLATGQFMADMPEERLTLITCWPYGINDHRVIIVAKPAEE